MRIQMITAGTTGSVAPYTGLAHRLRTEGHEVELVAHARFAASAGCCGMPTRSLEADPFESLIEMHRRMFGSRRSPGALVHFARALDQATMTLVDAILAAADPKADLMLLSSIAAPIGRTVARYHGVESMGVFLQPDLPTSEFPPCVMPPGPPSRLNRIRHRAANALLDRLTPSAYRLLHRRLGTSPRQGHLLRRERERERWPILHGFSPSVVPRPNDWRPDADVVGYWWPHECPDWTPPEGLSEFLESGPAPVMIGFGSMMPGDPDRLAGLITRALRSAGLRGVVQSGWAGLSVDDDDLLTIGPVPHRWLMPKTAAVVHHAGAGTTAAGLRAGVPAVPVPVFTDQPWWAAHLVRLGAAPVALPYRDLTAEGLSSALRRAVDDRSITERASAMAARLSEEDGSGAVARAVAELAG